MSLGRSKTHQSFSSDTSGLDKNLKLPSIKDFTIIKPISRGAFGKVFLGHKKDKPDQIFAVKVMKKDVMVNKNMIQQVLTERDALAVSRSPFVVQLFYSMQSKNNIFLVMEYMIGGDVKSLLHIYGFFDENMAVFYAAEAAQALEYLHQHNIVHRDLKPDNMLISSTGHMKLTDFGLSKITVKKSIKLMDLIGSPSCFNVESKHYLPNRTPGQLLSLTSKFAFPERSNSLNISSTASPYFPHKKRILDQRKSFSDQDLICNRQYSKSVKNVNDYSDVSPVKLETLYKGSYKKKPQSCNSVALNSYQNSSSSTTPFYPKKKRKILLSRSTKNFREIRSNSKYSLNSKLKINSVNTDKKTGSLNIYSYHVNKKRKVASSSEEDEFIKGQCSGITSVLSDLRFDDLCSISSEDISCKTSLCFSSDCKDTSEDSVFYNSPCTGQIKEEKKKRVHSTPSSKQMHLSFTNDKENVKKNVNFCFENNLIVHPFHEISHISPRRFSDSSSTAYQPELDKSCIKIENSLPAVDSSCNNKNRQIYSTPLRLAHTPYRTPKSVRRGPEPVSDQRILGTPDYLAPELLLHLEQGFPVDWWALGVCLYEFLTGIPPFNDVSAEAVFTNILKRDITWPEGSEALSDAAKSAIEMLLTFDYKQRPGAKELKTWPLFETIDWDNILHMKAPFIPVPDSLTDTTYFEARNEMQHIEVSSFDL